MLHKPNKDVRTRAYCGPTAMSAVTGLPVSLIRDAVREVSGRIETEAGAAHPVMGMRNEWMLDAMALLGWRVVDSRDVAADYYKGERRDRFTLGAFCADRGKDGPFIVNVTGHYVAVGGGEICDTYTGLPLDIASYTRRMGRWVQRWWKFAPPVEA